MLFKLVLDILNVSTKGARSVYSLPCFDFKLSIFPVLDDILSKLGLKFKLLISRRISVMSSISYLSSLYASQVFRTPGSLVQSLPKTSICSVIFEISFWISDQGISLHLVIVSLTLEYKLYSLSRSSISLRVSSRAG